MRDEEVGHGEEVVRLMRESNITRNGGDPRRMNHSVERRRSMDPQEQQRPQQNPFMMRLACLSMIILGLIGSFSMLTYFQNNKSPRYQFAPASTQPSNLVPNDNSFSKDVGGVSSATVSGIASSASKDALESLMKEAGVSLSSRSPQIVHYDPRVTHQNPFDFDTNILPNPMFPLLQNGNTERFSSLGFLQRPHLVRNQLVFCSQGDVFMTSLRKDGPTTEKPMSAVKLTTTVGNVLDPRLHPSLRYLAYTATYAGRRDIYLLDLQGGKPATRLTYWDTSAGVSGLIGWLNESTLVFRALSNEVSLPDFRLYILHLKDRSESSLANSTGSLSTQLLPTRQGVSMLQIDPVPLSQALDAARYQDCWYFVRYSQSSHTIRYVGGTAEQLYRYCDGATQTDRLLHQDPYKGTSKSPQMYPGTNFLFFLSDRGRKSGGSSWQPDRMNVWALPLSENVADHTKDKLIQITDTACDFEGRVIQEFSIDSATGNMILRIGADLYWMTADVIQSKLHGRRLHVNPFQSQSALINNGTAADKILIADKNITAVDDQFQQKSATATLEETIDLDSTIVNQTSNNETAADNETKVYYHYESPVLKARLVSEENVDHVSGRSNELGWLPIAIHSDFHTHQERILPVDLTKQLTSADVYETAVGTLQFVMTLRGQLWVAPIEEDSSVTYQGGGRNMPGRRYRLAPGASMGGLVRILAVRHVPNPVEDETSDRRLAVILATDPLTETAEHAFYLVETQPSATPLFLDSEHLPTPFLGGFLSGGSTFDGGLGSVVPESVKVSPCGRRMAWTDKDGRIVVMNLPQYQMMTDKKVPDTVVLPQQNENGQPMMGDQVDFSWSPGGRYLAIEHNARNQFAVISIADLGDPQGKDQVASIRVGRIVQATPDRFNCVSPYWGKSAADMHAFNQKSKMATVLSTEAPADVATALYFLSDRDIDTDVRSPWGTRQPMPHFKKQQGLYALPLFPTNTTAESEGPFSGGGAKELQVKKVLELQLAIKGLMGATSRRRLHESLGGAFALAGDVFSERDVAGLMGNRRLEKSNDAAEWEESTLRAATFPEDMDINFGPVGDRHFSFARNAYRLATIPEANYLDILSQTPDDASFVLLAAEEDEVKLNVFLADGFPSDQYTSKTFSPVGRKLVSYGSSSDGAHLFFTFSPDGQTAVVRNSAASLSKFLLDTELDDNIVSASNLHLSIWPNLEYRQLYDDAWRMLRDYFYDPDMTGIDWPSVHARYLPLVSRCSKREELDDVLVQMASELSALHVFVYGGEYDTPVDGAMAKAHSVASLGASFQRVPEWKGFMITSIAEPDPDFSILDSSTQRYSPLSDKTLRLSGQNGLKVGDVIVGVNGESVMKGPDLHMLLRGFAGHSVRLDVLRLASGPSETDSKVEPEANVESVIVVPMTSQQGDDLRYSAWEWKTRQMAEDLALQNGFSVGYIHLQDMSGPSAENAFARDFFPNYHKDALILDVRHNRGGNIDSWVLDVLQRKAWMYWQSRDFDTENGGLGWDEHFAFRGHVVVLIDEKTSSDGEGVSRGISELGLGRLIGTRTWGGGIWLASDNHLVDGGIATAPEIGTYNDKFGWGLGIEQMGVEPDIEVDNDPHHSYQGKDEQLETAILELKKWLIDEPIVVPKPPERKKDMTMGDRECSALR